MASQQPATDGARPPPIDLKGQILVQDQHAADSVSLRNDFAQGATTMSVDSKPVNGSAAPAPHENGEASTSPQSPTEAAKGTKSGADLLRRLSLVDATRQPVPQLTSPEDHPDLNLSGRIISAAFCIPYKLGFKPKESWVRNYPCLECRFLKILLPLLKLKSLIYDLSL